MTLTWRYAVHTFTQLTGCAFNVPKSGSHPREKECLIAQKTIAQDFPVVIKALWEMRHEMRLFDSQLLGARSRISDTIARITGISGMYVIIICPLSKL